MTLHTRLQDTEHSSPSPIGFLAYAAALLVSFASPAPISSRWRCPGIVSMLQRGQGLGLGLGDFL